MFQTPSIYQQSHKVMVTAPWQTMAARLLAVGRPNFTDSSPAFPNLGMQSFDICPPTTWDAPLWCQTAVFDHDRADTDLTL